MTRINYDDTDAIKAALVGKRIVRQEVGTRNDFLPTDYDGSLPAFRYTLDDGTQFIASDTDGGCACSNGCFEITPAESLPENVITDAEVVEEYSYGSDHDGEATIRLFVYQAGIKTELLHSQGGDNGYYGWGHNLYVWAAHE